MQPYYGEAVIKFNTFNTQRQKKNYHLVRTLITTGRVEVNLCSYRFFGGKKNRTSDWRSSLRKATNEIYPPHLKAEYGIYHLQFY